MSRWCELIMFSGAAAGVALFVAKECTAGNIIRRVSRRVLAQRRHSPNGPFV